MVADISALRIGVGSIKGYVLCTWAIVLVIFVVLVVSMLWKGCI